MNIKLEKISHYAVIVIAILAFLMSIIQTRIQHHHNKLTVRPILTVTLDQIDSTIAVYIENKGVGPAIIKDALFIKDGKTYHSTEKMLKESGLSCIRMGGYTLSEGTVISATERRLLVMFRGRYTKGVKAAVEYESIYEEPYKINFSF